LAVLLARDSSYPDTDQHSDLASVASYYKAVTDRTYLTRRLDDIFGREFQPNKLHEFIARLAQIKPLTIITTTFDCMLESALDKYGVSYTLTSNWMEKGQLCLLYRPYGEAVKLIRNPEDIRYYHEGSSNSIIYKLYGSAPFSQLGGSYIQAEEDRVSLLVELGSGGLVPPIISIRVKTENKHNLFLGTSLRGWIERWFFRDIERLRGRRGWAISRSPSPLDALRWKQLGVELYDIHLPVFVENLISVF
jgi:hypothetical protein